MATSGVMSGLEMHDFARKLWSLPRSITGSGLRRTLEMISEELGGLSIYEVPSGTAVGDWVIPDEWTLRRSILIDPHGKIICDSDVSNLHVVNYSEPFDGKMELGELQQYLHSLPDLPTAVPYMTSYYERRWGFCLPHQIRERLVNGVYTIRMDTDLQPGSLTYGDLVIPGKSKKEILISTYVCHPSMANNELSGPVVSTNLIKYLRSLNSRRYTYRFVFAPETIGAITYIHNNLEHLRKHVVGALNLTCLGDDRTYSLLPTRGGKHRLDTIARHVLKHLSKDYVEYPWTSRGSDERQYSSPGLDLPMISIMRSKYWEYPEYHTSLDDLVDLVTPSGLQGGFQAIQRTFDILECDVFPGANVVGEPMLSRRNLYSTLGGSRFSVKRNLFLDVWSFCDGTNSALDIAHQLNLRFDEVLEAVTVLQDNHLVVTSPVLLD
jgi:aminopeptidase-like protein